MESDLALLPTAQNKFQTRIIPLSAKRYPERIKKEVHVDEKTRKAKNLVPRPFNLDVRVSTFSAPPFKSALK
jgi:hypothetical protein